MAKQHWGRKEKVIWPPQVPIWTYGALLLALPIGLLFFVSLYISKPLLERSSTGVYLRAAFGSLYSGHGKYRLVYVGGGKRAPRPAQSVDMVPGTTVMRDGKELAGALSPDAITQGYTTFFRGPERMYQDVRLAAWLQAAVFDGHSLLGSYSLALTEWSVILIGMLCFTCMLDYKRSAVLKYGRLLRGPIMLAPKKFNKILEGTGLGIRTTQRGTILRLPMRSEAKHIQVMGDTGVGKTTLLIQMLSQIQDRKEVAIVNDPAGEFTQRFYNESRGDIILNPLDARCPYWDPSSELRTPAEARTIATSLYQPNDDKKGEFFTESPQKIFAHLLKYRPTPQELVAWMCDPAEIDRRVENTEFAALIAKDSADQRNGVLGSLGLIADGLRLLPTMEQAGHRVWSATNWAEKREGWIFLTSTESEQEALRPLHSLWIDLLVLRLLTLPKPGQTRAWLVLDELATLQRLPQFHTALTKGRKSNNPIIFGYQGKAQLEVIYGHLAEVMLSQPATKIVMKTAEPKAAKWASELIGEIEIERVRETVADGKRAGKSFTMDRQIEPLVMGSEIEGLDDLHAFMKLGNYVTRFSFPHMDRPIIAPALEKRPIAESEQWLEPMQPLPAAPLVPKPVPAAVPNAVPVSVSQPGSMLVPHAVAVLEPEAKPDKTETPIASTEPAASIQPAPPLVNVPPVQGVAEGPRPEAQTSGFEPPVLVSDNI